MSVVAPPRPSSAPAPAPAPKPTIRAPRTWTWRLLTLGTTLILVLVVGVVVIFEAFGGEFATYTTVDAELPASSTAVALNAPVEYRNVTVGEVSSEGKSVPGGLVSVTLHLKPSMLSSIPAGVHATETPVSFFGDAYLVLVPPAHPGTATLKAGATIPALTTGQTASLQATLGDLDYLLISLHPARLDAALTALAGALQGQGTSLGKNFDKGNNYFKEMLPLWPTVVSNLNTLVPVANQFAASTPDILQILANQTTTGHTITSDATNVRNAISGGASLAGDVSQLLTAIQQPYEVLTADSAPFLQDISQNPTEIAHLLEGFNSWANAWISAESSGPYLNLTTTVVVANPADLGLAVVGGADVNEYLSAGLGPGYVNPATYTSAGSIPAGTSLTSSEHATVAELDNAISNAPSQVLPEPAQSNAISQIVRSITGSDPTSPTVSTLLLSPVLEGLVHQ
ncbi:MAG: MCE family protein [Acidimicrobiales bacterium]|jgi:phospholipid/cholesterol/gamma-HCH transport system substrate-binding protein